MRDSIEERRTGLEDMRKRTVGLIESRLDESVRGVFRQLSDTMPARLAEYDRELERVLVGYLRANGIKFKVQKRKGERLLDIPSSDALPQALADGLKVAIGAVTAADEIESVHVAHPVIDAAIDEARQSGAGHFRLRLVLPKKASPALGARRGSRGRLALTRISHRGFEREDRLRVTAVFEDSEVLQPAAAALELMLLDCDDVEAFDPPIAVPAEDLDEVVDEELFLDQSAVGSEEQVNFEKAIDQLDQYMEDRILILRRARERLSERLRDAETKRDNALGPDARQIAEVQVRKLTLEVEALEGKLLALEARDDDVYRRWQEQANNRRYQAPVAERLFTAEFILE